MYRPPDEGPSPPSVLDDFAPGWKLLYTSRKSRVWRSRELVSGNYCVIKGARPQLGKEHRRNPRQQGWRWGRGGRWGRGRRFSTEKAAGRRGGHPIRGARRGGL